MSEPFLFIVGCLAVFRVAELFVIDNGPWEVFKRLRSLFPEGSNLDNLLECFYCQSSYWSIFVCWLTGLIVPLSSAGYVLWWLGIWGGAVAIYRVVPCRK
jgi:hypothetical protein